MNNNQASALTGLWLIWVSMLLILLSITLFFNFTGDQYRLETPTLPPEFLRTMLYGVTIATFPLSNLIRHIMIRLNQTMPGEASAKSRYIKTILAAMALASSIGDYGILLYLWGDTISTLIIFSSLSALAFWLYRPKREEFDQIVAALASDVDEGPDD